MEYVFSHQKMTDANNAMLQQYRASREEFLGKTIRFQSDAQYLQEQFDVVLL